MRKISLQFYAIKDQVLSLQQINWSTLFIENSERQMDATEFLRISQSDLERNKFCFLAYRVTLKAKQIIDEPNVMGTKLV